jgi:hypothetical protein
MLQVVNRVAFSVSQPVEHPLRRFPADLSVRSQVPHRVSSPLEFCKTSAMRALPRLRRVWAFVCSHATSTQNFSVLVIRNFMCSSSRTAESLGQISALRVGRPRHHPPGRKNMVESGGTGFCEEPILCDSRQIPGEVSSANTSANDAVKYRQRNTNLSSTSQVHTSQYWDCVSIKSQRADTRWGTADNERACHTPKWTERITAARYMYRRCQNGQNIRSAQLNIIYSSLVQPASWSK